MNSGFALAGMAFVAWWLYTRQDGVSPAAGSTQPTTTEPAIAVGEPNPSGGGGDVGDSLVGGGVLREYPNDLFPGQMFPSWSGWGDPWGNVQTNDRRSYRDEYPAGPGVVDVSELEQ
jgi:hypothetical protein